jgi:hypothetical protein
VDLHFAREHDLLELARARSARPRARPPLVVLGRHRARHLKAPGRRRVEQRQRASAQLRHAALQAREQLLGGVVGRASAASVSHRRLAARSLRTSATSGTVSDAGSKPAQCGAAPPSGGEREAAQCHRTPTHASAAGSSAGSDTAAADSARQRSATTRSAPRPRLQARASPSAASAARPRSGCSNTNQRSPGRREAHTTAEGSTSRATGSEIVASTSPPARARAAPLQRQPRRQPRASSALNAKVWSAPVGLW